MIDVRCFGLQPTGHHLISVVLHYANTLLLFFALKSMTEAIWRSAFVAGLFALHPLHVESVAWAAERKDVLSGFFFMLALLAYVGYVKRLEDLRREIRDRHRKSADTRHDSIGKTQLWYCASLMCFVLGLISKPMLVTLPFVLLLLDYWPLSRFRIGRRAPDSKPISAVLLEKLPFLALAVASSTITFFAQKQGGATLSLREVPLAHRLANAVVAYFTYLFKLFWPIDLTLPYLPPQHWKVLQIGLAVLTLLSITLLVLGPWRRLPYMAVGWLWFMGMLIPVSGLVQVGSQFMADRYMYLPLIGCFIVISWGCWQLVRKWNVPQLLPFAAAIVVFLVAGALARHQVGFWRNSETFFRHAVAVDADNYVAHDNLGSALAEQGRFDEAKGQFRESLRIRPDGYFALYNLGLLLATRGEFTEAAPLLKKVVELNPSSANVYGKLGFAFAAQGRLDVAIVYYKEWVKNQPNEPMALNNLAWTLATASEAKLRDGNAAVFLAQKASDLTHDQQPPIVGTLAAAYAEAGHFSDAINTAERAIALARSAGMSNLAEKNGQLLTLYRAGKAYHEPPIHPSTNSPQHKP